MTATNSPARRRFRLLRAYSVTMRVLISLGWTHLLGKLLGPNWLARQLPERYRMTARRIKEVILELKGLFIKVGQLISIMSNFLPEDFRKELEGLQDRIPPRPLEEIERRFQSEFGKSPQDIFAHFEPTAIASASLAQVHRAKLHDGRQVAVKVQYSDIEEIARLDLRAIRRIVQLVGFVLRVSGLDASFEQVRETIMEELDFQREAQNIEEIAANFVDHSNVGFPAVVREYSTQRILTTDFIAGAKITDLDAIASLGIDREMLAERVLTAYCRMIFTDGLYHADPHPGNILVRSDGGIVFIDFGAVARLSPQMKEGIPEFLEGVIRRDEERILRALRRMGFTARGEESQAVKRLIDYFYSRFLDEMSLDSWNLKDIHFDLDMKMEVIADFRNLNISFRDLTAEFQVPKDWFLLQRTILLLMGLCTHLSPTMNPMKTIRPYLESFVLGKNKDWKELITGVVKDMVLSAIAIPADLRQLLAKSNRGELQMHVAGLRESTHLLYSLGQQLLFGFLMVAAGSWAYVAHTNGEIVLARGLIAAGVVMLVALTAAVLSGRRLKKRAEHRS